MALTDKNIVITPNLGSSTDDPKIVFTAASTNTTATITVKAYPTSNGTLSFEGSAGQLFSIANTLTGTIFSVNDISGMPSIQVADTGLITLAGPGNGYVYIASNTTATSTSTGALVVTGGAGIGGSLYVGGTATVGGAAVWTTATLTNNNQLTNGSNYLTSGTIGLYGVSTINAGTGISVSASTGSVTVTNIGVVSLAGSTYLGISAASGSNITLTNLGVQSVTGTQNLGVSGSTGTITLTNLGVTATIGTTYLGVSGTTGSITFTNLGVQSLTAGADLSVSASTGTITVNSTATLQSITNRGFTTTNAINVTNATASTSTTTGALLVAGGVGIGGSLYVAGEIVAQKLTIQLTTITTTLVVTDDQIQTVNTTQSTSTNTGALQVVGGVGIGGNAYVGGLLNVAGGITGTVTTATNIAGGTIGAIHYQSAAGVTQFIGIGGSGQLLQSNGTTATWVSLGALTAGIATTATNIAGGNSGLIHIQSAAGITTFINSGTSGQLLQMGTNTATWVNANTIAAGSAISATTSTNITGGTIGALPYQSAVGVTQFIGIGGSGQLLQSNGTTATWVSTGTLGVGFASTAGYALTFNTATLVALSVAALSATTAATAATATTATNIAGGTIGALPYQSTVGTTNFITIGSAGTLLQSNGTTATWVSVAGLTAGLASTATNIAAGTAGQIHYQTSPGITAFTGPGSAGQILTSNGTSAPAYQNTLTLAGTTAATSTTTGALIVAGGVGVGGSLYVAGEIVAAKLTIQLTTITTTLIQTDDIIQTVNVTQATSTSTGALQVGGGAGIGGNLWVGGTLNGVANLSGTVTNATNIAGGTVGALHYQSAVGVTQFIGIGSNGQLLQSNGTTATWVSLGALTAGIATTATNIQNGTAGQIPIQTAAGITSFIVAGTAGQLLQSNGTTSTFVSTSTLLVGNALSATTASFATTSGFAQSFNTATLVALSVAALSATTSTSAATAYALANTSTTYVGRAALADSATAATNATNATNIAGGTTGALHYQSAAGVTQFIGIGGSGQLLQSNGTTATWVSLGALTAGIATTATNIQNGSAGQIPYQTAAGLTGFAGPGTAGQILTSNGTSAPAYQNTLTLAGTTVSTNTTTGALIVRGGAGVGGNLYVGGQINVLGGVVGSVSGVITTATNLAGGTAGQIHYQTAAGLTAFAGPGSAGQILTSNGTAAPAYQNTLTLAGTTAATSTTTGALIVAGGVGVGGSLYVAGEIVAAKLTIQLTTITTTLIQTDDIIQTINVTQATSTATGALQVAGGAGIGGNLWVGGTLNVAGGISGSITTATNIAGGTAGALVYQSAVGATQFIGIGGSGSVLQSNGTTATWVALSALTAANATTATNIAGGTAGQIHYQTSPGITAFAGPGTAGQLLVSNGAAAPVYQNTLTLAGTTQATSTNTGALQVGGGVGVGGAAFIGGNLTVTSTLASTSTTTGALQVAGGVGIGGAVVVGGTIAIGATPKNVWGGFANLDIGAGGVIRSGASAGNGSQFGINFYTDSSFVTKYKYTGYSGYYSVNNLPNMHQWVSYGSGTAENTITSSLMLMTLYNSGGLYLGSSSTDPGPGNLIVAGTATSISTTTGALQVAGGVGIGGNLYVGGVLYATVSGSINTASSIANGTAGALLYQTAPGATGFLTPGTNGWILTSNGTTPFYQNTATVLVGDALRAASVNNITGGAAGSIPIQRSAGVTDYIPIGPAGYLLQSQGTTATWVSTGTLVAGTAIPRVLSTTSSATAVTPNISQYDQYVWTAQAATLTINAPTGTPVDGSKLLFRILDNGTQQTINWDGTYTVIGVTLPATTTINKTTYVGVIYNLNNTRWDVIAVGTQA